MPKKIHNKVLEKVPTHSDFYIRQNPNKLSSEELAEETGLTVVVVERILEDQKVLLEKEQKKIDSEKKKKRDKEDNIYTQALGRKKRNNEYVATVMTQVAAEIADKSRESNISKANKSKKNDARFIHNPKD